MGTDPQTAHETVFRLFHEGHKLENIVSAWRMSESRIADLVVAGHRQGERVDVAWLVRDSIRDRLIEVIRTRDDLSPVQISSLFKGAVTPPIVRALKVILGGGYGIDSRIFNEDTFAEKFRDDLAGARREILVVAPEVKGRHWRRYLDSLRHVVIQEGVAAFFCGRVSELVEDEIKDQKIVLIQNEAHANLVLIDGHLLWEGSMNFLLPPRGGEHVRRTDSRLLCDEIRDLHDLYL